MSWMDFSGDQRPSLHARRGHFLAVIGMVLVVLLLICLAVLMGNCMAERRLPEDVHPQALFRGPMGAYLKGGQHGACQGQQLPPPGSGRRVMVS
jgi:hypothetical protein